MSASNPEVQKGTYPIAAMVRSKELYGATHSVALLILPSARPHWAVVEKASHIGCFDRVCFCPTRVLWLIAPFETSEEKNYKKKLDKFGNCHYLLAMTTTLVSSERQQFKRLIRDKTGRDGTRRDGMGAA